MVHRVVFAVKGDAKPLANGIHSNIVRDISEVVKSGLFVIMVRVIWPVQEGSCGRRKYLFVQVLSESKKDN